jgi:heme exporter protein CcmD
MNLHNLLNMSGYAAYVWPCYGLTLAALIWMLWSARRQWQDELVRAKRRTQVQQEAQR